MQARKFLGSLTKEKKPLNPFSIEKATTLPTGEKKISFINMKTLKEKQSEIASPKKLQFKHIDKFRKVIETVEEGDFVHPETSDPTASLVFVQGH